MISKHFSRGEFKCRCNKCFPEAVDINLLTVLEGVREHFRQSVTITSGWRCEAHNKAVGGAAASKHLYGIAADIVVNGTTPEEVYKYLDKTYPQEYGLGLYRGWVHVDVRTNKSRWKK